MLNKLLCQTRADAADKVKYEESLGAPHVFDAVAEHPEGEHVEKQMRETTVHEHVRHKLIRPEIRSADVVQAEILR